MSKKAHYNPKSLKWLISLAIMIILSVGVVFGTIAIQKAISEKNSQPVDIDFNISMTIPLAVKDNDLNVTGVEKALDEQGNIVAYVIKHQTVGYNQEVPIEMASTISADADLICGIEILKQEETEYLGVRINEEGFRNQFKGRKLPVKSASSLKKGSEIDLIARSTISSEAVIDGVNNAQKYVKTYLAE